MPTLNTHSPAGRWGGNCRHAGAKAEQDDRFVALQGRSHLGLPSCIMPSAHTGHTSIHAPSLVHGVPGFAVEEELSLELGLDLGKKKKKKKTPVFDEEAPVSVWGLAGGNYGSATPAEKDRD